MRAAFQRLVLLFALLIIGYALSQAVDSWRAGDIARTIMNGDFETGDLTGWTGEGEAFLHQPTLGNNPAARGREGSNHQGRWWIGGFERYLGRTGQTPGDIQGDAPMGTLTSDPFTIRGHRIRFLIGGGNHPSTGPDGRNATCVNLQVDGEIVRTATGNNSETLQAHSWDVSSFRGREAVIQLVDTHPGNWGHINFDDVRQMSRWQAEKGNYLLYLWTGVVLLLAVMSKS